MAHFCRFFANVQQLVERAVIGSEVEVLGPAPIAASFKPFPWPAVHIDLGAWVVCLVFIMAILLRVYSLSVGVYGHMQQLGYHLHMKWLCIVRKLHRQDVWA